MAFCFAALLAGPARALDGDGDGFEPPDDCNDASANQAPGLVETCDGFDNDCDGDLDEAPSCARICETLDPSGAAAIPTLGGGDSSQAALAWTGSGFGLAWTEEVAGVQDIHFALLDGGGGLAGAVVPVTGTASPARAPALAWTGSGFGLAWVDLRDGNEEIYVQALDAAGAPQGTASPVTSDPAFSGEPSLVWSGDRFILAWTEAASGNREIVVAALDAGMSLLAGPLAVSSDAAVSEQPSLAWGHGGGLVAWTDERDGNREIYVRPLDAAGAPTGSAMPATMDPALSAQPSAAWTGAGYAVAWTDERDGNREIYLRPVGADGVPGGSAVRQTQDGAISDQPVLGWTGQELAFAWRDTRVVNGEIYLARAALDGTVQGQPLRISNDLGLLSRRPDLAWTGGGWTVAWDDIEVSVQPVVCACSGADADGDGFAACQDCDDGDPAVYPGAEQICDGLNNDCGHPSWPLLTGVPESDDDGDGLAECDGDCDDGEETVFPGAEQVCDGLNNDCGHPSWPSLTGVPESDDDGDGLAECDGDCDDTAAAIRPGASETCNGVDDDCNLLVDDVAGVVDGDGDGVPGACDVCPATPDPDQTDSDLDGFGDACDVCPLAADPAQSDADGDGQGDLCDPDDGLLIVQVRQADRLEWDIESGINRYNAYRGDLAVLRSAGLYTQVPGGLAAQGCDLTGGPWVDGPALAAGDIVHYLLASGRGGSADDLGTDSTGLPRPNDNPCP